MNSDAFKLAEGIVSPAYVRQAQQAISQREKKIRNLLANRRLPDQGWDDTTINLFLQQLSLMDSNNFLENAGAGEREGRVYSDIVSRRHFGLAHGVGRSGDLTAIQPKAAGSSLLYQLTNKFALNILHTAGLNKIESAIVVPCATGMTLMMSMMLLRMKRPQATHVIWPRIDQKTCLKAILSAGLKPIIVENDLVGDELQTNVDEIAQILKNQAEDVLCVLSTVSCFAPRAYERVGDLASLCKDQSVPHVVNNAYGVQDRFATNRINLAMAKGRVDCVVQSTDKNFMVPVGGAVVGGSKSMMREWSEQYPGRASSSPIVDLFITLLSMGINGYKKLIKERKYLQESLESIASKHGERVLSTPNNRISIALTLSTFKDPTYIGSKLFTRGCSGMRSVSTTAKKQIGPHTFVGYGAHANEYPFPYMTFAAAIGGTTDEVDVLMSRLDKVLATSDKNDS